MSRTVKLNTRSTAYLKLLELANSGEIHGQEFDFVYALVKAAYRENVANLRSITEIWMTSDPKVIAKHLSNTPLHHAMVHNKHTDTETLRKILATSASEGVKQVANNAIRRRGMRRR